MENILGLWKAVHLRLPSRFEITRWLIEIKLSYFCIKLLYKTVKLFYSVINSSIIREIPFLYRGPHISINDETGEVSLNAVSTNTKYHMRQTRYFVKLSFPRVMICRYVRHTVLLIGTQYIDSSISHNAILCCF